MDLGMKRFKFQFETVERVRKSKQEEALRLLAGAQRQVQQAKDLRAALVKDLEESLARREKLGAQAVNVASFLLENDFIAGTKQRIVQADHAILRANRAMEKALRNYLFARRQTRMVEVLRDKRFEEFKKAAAKYEQKQADDLNVMRARLLQEAAG